MGEVPFFKEIFNIFDKKNGIQKHLLQTLRKIHIIKREVERIYDEAPIVTGTLQLGGKNATVDSSCHLRLAYSIWELSLKIVKYKFPNGLICGLLKD